MIRKCLAVGIILLFVGVTIAPTINSNTVKASTDNDTVEVTTQACGIQGYGNITVKLTREQYNDLEQYLIEFRARLNQTTTREEAVPIFKEAVTVLNKYGLLPKETSVEQAQKLVTGKSPYIGNKQLMEKPSSINLLNTSNNSNYLCLVCGTINGTYFDEVYSIRPVLHLMNNFFYLLFLTGFADKIFNLLNNNSLTLLSKIYSHIMGIILFLLVDILMTGAFVMSLNPINIMSTVTLGTYRTMGYYPLYSPAYGWVMTFGVNGKRIFQNQPLWGNLPVIPILNPFGSAYLYPGMIDFTGINIRFSQKEINYYLGSALWVKIGSEPPQNITMNHI
jgi:hypothetical protein